MRQKLRFVKRGLNLAFEIMRSLAKDAQIELRSPSAIGTAIAFAGITTLAVSLVSGGINFSANVLSILLWVILFFSAMNSLLHVFTREEEQQTVLFLSLSVSPESVYLSKLLFNVLFFFVIELIVCPFFLFFMNVSVIHILLFILTVLGGGLAISASATILAAMAAKAGGKGSLFTIIAFPIILPVLWVSISTTTSCFLQDAASYNNVFFLFAFSVTIIAISYLMFRYIWIEE